MATNDPKWERLRKNKSFRESIYERDNYKCVYCGVRVSKDTATLDHVRPKSKIPDHRPNNLVTACRDCNNRKHAKTLYQFANELDQPVYQVLARVNMAIGA